MNTKSRTIKERRSSCDYRARWQVSQSVCLVLGLYLSIDYWYWSIDILVMVSSSKLIWGEFWVSPSESWEFVLESIMCCVGFFGFVKWSEECSDVFFFFRLLVMPSRGHQITWWRQHRRLHLRLKMIRLWWWRARWWAVLLR